MTRRLALSALLALLALAAVPALAPAAWFPAQPVDGPSPDVERLGGVDLARDGTGGVVYLKRVEGATHVFLSRFTGGQFRPPERVDNGIGTGAGEAVIAAADNHRLAIVWSSGSRVYGAVVSEDRQPGALLGPTPIYDDPSGAPTDLAIDMGINGAAYATWAGPGGGGGDVRAVRLTGTSWEQIGPALDVDPAQRAGRGAQRSDVGVSAEGNAVVAWGENHADGRPRVYARRLTGLNPSVAPQEVSVGEYAGAPGGPADSVDIDIEDDGSFGWAVFRQDFGGVTRSLGRRLLGSTFDPPAFDAGPGARSPRLAMNGRGQGLAVADNGSVFGSFLYNDAFQPGGALNSQPSAQGLEPQAGASEHREVVAVWRIADGAGNASLKGRLKPDNETGPFDGEVELSRPDLGAVPQGQYAVAADRLAGFAVAMMQGAPGGRSLTVAVHDRPPGRPGAVGRNKWVSAKRLRWRPGTDLWGRQRFRVVVGGRVLGETTGRSLRSSSSRLRGGRRVTYRVIAIDSRGQETPSRTQRVRFDGSAPSLSVNTRRRGRTVQVTARAAERRGSGVSQIRVRYGDSRRVVRRRGTRFAGSHVYRRRGTFTLRVTAYDRAGNTRAKTVRLRIS